MESVQAMFNFINVLNSVLRLVVVSVCITRGCWSN